MSALPGEADSPTALVLGANGQDGTWLVRTLLAKGYAVIGVGRQPSSRHVSAEAYDYRQLDLRDAAALDALLNETNPEQIFHLAAVHASASGNHGYEPIFREMLDVNVASLHVALEHLRQREKENDRGRLLYASSAKVFGSPLPERIDEDTAKRSDCLYAVTKNAAGSMIEQYRRKHAVAAASVYLFNHESELRPAGFFIPKLVDALVDAIRGDTTAREFFTLQFQCDWGSAAEYMDIASGMLERAPGEDFVLASGRCLSAEALVDTLFSRRGLEAKAHIREQRNDGGGPSYDVSLNKLQRLLGRTPTVTIEQVVDDWVDARLA